jgi:hypothetical protein
VYALEEVPSHERKSKNFDFDTPVEKPRKRYIPPMSHPWKQASFEKFMNKQAHRKEKRENSLRAAFKNILNKKTLSYQNP